MSVVQLLSQLREKGAHLRVENGNLHVRGPAGALTEDLRRALTQHKQEILSLLEQHEVAPPIKPVPRDSALPLSFAQQRLWFLQQLTPGSAAYNVCLHHRLTGLLDMRALERSLNEIVRRHESLRTTFTAVDGNPVQVIASPQDQRQPIVDLSGLTKLARERETRRLARTGMDQPFDLSEGPLLRSKFLRLGIGEHVWLLEMHHAIWDGWSLGVFRRELEALYQSFCARKISPLPELPVQYADFAQWQKQWLQGARLERELSYWRTQLDCAPSLLELPTDRPRKAAPSYAGRALRVTVQLDLVDRLRNLSHDTRATLFMTLLAAFQVLLWRHSGQADIVVGSPIAGRIRPEIEGLIGFFVNTLVLRSNLADNPTFREFLVRVRKTALDAYAHQDLPFECLVEQLQPERNPSYSPLFQVMFALQNAPDDALALQGVTVERMASSHGTAKFDLALSLVEGPLGIRGSLSYNADLFDEVTIQRMVGHFEVLLEGIAADPERRVSALPFLTDAEERRLLVEWNDTRVDFPNDLSLHELFEAQVRRTPDAVALVYEARQLTYRELNQRANQLAHYLLARGVGPDVLVAICLERSLEMVIGLLGILKAGGAYVPLDPEYPQERLAFMLKDSQAPVVLTEQRLAETIAGNGARVFCLDTGSEAISQESDESPISGTSADNLAYVIYTSGSTGRAKGIVTAHRAICNQMLWIQANWPLTNDDRVLQKTSFSFDVSLWELFWPLQVGASLIMARPGGHKDSVYLREVIIAEGITMIHFVPSMLSIFLLDPGLEACHGLRQVLCGGEALSFELQKRFFGRLPADLLHFYGPTEASVTATGWTCERKGHLGMVPLGAPVANTQIYLLDRYLELASVGVPGELHIGGVGLARGYLNQPELTAEKFIANPLNHVPGRLEQGEPGGRLYQTGDLARYRSDGNLEFLGRIDHQVKIRGFRVEPGEIEAVLCEHTAVREAVVLVREDVSGERLVAYAIPNQGASLAIGELRGFLKEKLPNYMVPSSFVLMDVLPLTPNGKVDRDALPEPDGPAPDHGQTFVAPRTQVEDTIAAIWQEVLNLERVGVDDDFFELGGHSLLAIQVLSRLCDRFQIELPLRGLFESTTVAAQAETIETMRWAAGNLRDTSDASPEGSEEEET